MNAVCPNCVTYNWPREGVAMSTCSSCKFLSYCSKECQKEHWVKVHKEQCLALAGKVEVAGSVHMPENCPGCKEDEALVLSPSSSSWGCLLPAAACAIQMGEFSSAVPMGEMTRKFQTRSEQTVFVMQQIVDKLVKTNSLLARECRDEMNDMAKMLDRMRSSCRITYYQFPQAFVDRDLTAIHEDNSHIREIFLDELLNKPEVMAISATSAALGAEGGDPFLAWESFKSLTGFLFWSNLHNKHIDFEKLGMENEVPDELMEMVAELGSSTQFQDIWDEVLTALGPGLVHHSDLLDILCGGNREQKCAECSTDITIERVFTMDTSSPWMKFNQPFVTFRCRIFSCSGFFCQMLNKSKEVEFHKKISAVINSITSRLVANRCDYCGLLGRKAHRCKDCKTKVYCSQECQSSDWFLVHKKICNKGEVARKVRRRGRSWDRSRRRILLSACPTAP